MRIVVDALGAPRSSGGMRTYVEEVLSAWTEEFDDELVLLGYEYLRPLVSSRVRLHTRPEGTRARIIGQWWGAGALARAESADALLSLSTVVSPFAGSARRVCVVHDLRHRVNPEEFGTLERAYRRSWRWSVRRADAVAAISGKTRRETLALAPRARVEVVGNGRDHARRWAPASGHDPITEPYVLTFGHFVNKRPELVIDAFRGVAEPWRLVILGARDEYAESLRRRAVEAGVGDRIDLPGFVETARYQQLVRSAGAVVLASSDEGFGLPVAEANYLGVPCIVTSDSGLPEIHGDRVEVAAPVAADLARALTLALGGARPSSPLRVEETWAATARGLRELCGGRPGR